MDRIWLEGSLGIWLIIALLALLVVTLELIFNKNSAQQQKTDMAKSDFNMFKSAQAWNISIFMGLQSLVYYSLVSGCRQSWVITE